MANLLRHFVRRSPVETWSDGATVLIDIPRQEWIKSMVLKFTGTITIGVADASAVVAESVLKAIRRIRILADGEPILDWTGPLAYEWARLNNGIAGAIDAPAVTVATDTFSVHIPLGPAYDSDFNETDNLIPANGYDSLQAEITCGSTTTDFLTPAGTTTLAVSATTLQIISQHHVPGPPNAQGISAARRFSTERIGVTVSGVNTDAETTFSKRNVFVNGILIRQVSDGVLVDTVVTSAQVYAGGYEVYPWQTVADNRAFFTGPAGIAPSTGYLYIPFKLEGKTLESIRMNSVDANLVVHCVEAHPGTADSYEVCAVEQSEAPAAVSDGN